MCLHRQTATSQAMETEDESAIAQNWCWPKKKKSALGESQSLTTPKAGETATPRWIARPWIQKHFKENKWGSPGSVSRRRRGMLSEREKVKEGREVNEDSRMKESQKKRHERKMRRKCEERTEGQTDVFLLHCEQRFSLVWILAALFYVLRGRIT